MNMRHLIFPIIALSLILSLYNLGENQFSFDDIHSIYVSQRSLSALVKLHTVDVQEPLYNLVLKVWFSIMPINEITARMVSILAGLGAAYIIFLLGTRLFSVEIGLMAAFLFVINPTNIWSMRIAKEYALLVFLCVASTYFLALAQAKTQKKKDHLRNYVLYALFSVLALYTHVFAVLVIFCQGAWILLLGKSRREWLLTQASIWLLFIPGLILFIHQFLNNRAIVMDQPLSLYTLWNVDTWMLLGSKVMLIALVTMIILYFFKKSDAQRKSILFLMIWTFAPFLILAIASLLISPVTQFGYLYIIVPGVCLLISALLDSLLRNKYAKMALFALLTASIFLSIANDYHQENMFNYNMNDTWDFRGVAQFIKENATPKDSITIVHFVSHLPIAYYYNPDCVKERPEVYYPPGFICNFNRTTYRSVGAYTGNLSDEQHLQMDSSLCSAELTMNHPLPMRTITTDELINETDWLVVSYYGPIDPVKVIGSRRNVTLAKELPHFKIYQVS